MPVRGIGFFANETLHEVHKAGAKVDETDQAFFVPESELDRYAEEELAFEGEDGQPARRRYDPGTFIFRLAGRDRETSASYYTPEVLTDCLVKYALKELLDGFSSSLFVSIPPAGVRRGALASVLPLRSVSSSNRPSSVCRAAAP